MLFELLLRNVEPLDDLVCRDHGVVRLAAGREQVREQCLQDGEAFGHDRAGRALAGDFHARHRRGRGELGRSFLVPLTDGPERLGDLAAELVRLDRDRAPVLPQHPGCELRERGVARDEHAVLQLTCVAECALDPPGGVPGELDARFALDVADLPRRPAAVLVDVEFGRDPEVPLTPRGESDVTADAGDAEGSDVLAVEILADHVPAAVVREQSVRIDRSFALAVTGDRVVRELDRALFRDRSLELPQSSRHLRRVVGVEHLDANGGVRSRFAEALATERKVLECQPQRLRVGELSFQQVQRGLERRELVVLQLELGEEVVLRTERVELLAGELVALRLERHTERKELGAVGVEAPGEGLVGHLRVTLDIRLHVARGQKPSLRHQVGDERQLPDQLVGVVRHLANLAH